MIVLGVLVAAVTSVFFKCRAALGTMTEWGSAVAEDRSGGHGYGKHIDCNSALALIGFILFIDILRDIIADLPDTGRKKRDVAPWEASLAEVHRSPFAAPLLSGAVVDDLVTTTPGLLAVMGTEQLGEGAPGPCAHRELCERGTVFAARHGAAGRLLYTLYSNVLSRGFSGGDQSLEGTLVEAARAGRTGQDCGARYPGCSSGFQETFGDVQEDPDDGRERFKGVAKGDLSISDCNNANNADEQVGATTKLNDDPGIVSKNVLENHGVHYDVLESIDDSQVNNMINDFRISR